MQKKIKKFIGDVMSNVVASVFVSLIAYVGAPCAMLWSAVKTFVHKMDGTPIPLLYWIVLSVSFCIAITIIITNIVCSIKKRNRPQFPKIQSDIRCEKAISQFYFETRENMSCSREVHLEVTCEKMSSLIKQFQWTGSDYRGTVLEDADGNYVLNDCARKKSPYEYEVRFDTPKTRGEKLWYKARTDVCDNGRDMKPFFSHMVKSPTDSLELIVTAPRGLLHNVNYVIYADTLGEIPISEPLRLEGKVIGNLETFSQKIEKPNLLYTYRINWKFSE